VQKKNEVWFRPFGLDIPDDLAGVCQQLKDKFTAEKLALEREKNSVFHDPTWSAKSKIGRVMSSLQIDTDLKPFRGAETFSPADEARLIKLRADLQQDGKIASGKV